MTRLAVNIYCDDTFRSWRTDTQDSPNPQADSSAWRLSYSRVRSGLCWQTKSPTEQTPSLPLISLSNNAGVTEESLKQILSSLKVQRRTHRLFSEPFVQVFFFCLLPLSYHLIWALTALKHFPSRSFGAAAVKPLSESLKPTRSFPPWTVKASGVLFNSRLSYFWLVGLPTTLSVTPEHSLN